MKLSMEEYNPEQFKVLPVDSIVVVQVDDVKQRTVTGGARGDWEKLEFRCTVESLPDSLVREYSDVLGASIWGSVAARFTEHPDNKLRQWTEALFGIELHVGFELDTDDLIGKKARAVIGQYQRKDQTFQHQIAALLPLGAIQSPTATAQDPWGTGGAKPQVDPFAAVRQDADKFTQETASVGASPGQATLDDEPPF